MIGVGSVDSSMVASEVVSEKGKLINEKIREIIHLYWKSTVVQMICVELDVDVLELFVEFEMWVDV